MQLGEADGGLWTAPQFTRRYWSRLKHLSVMSPAWAHLNFLFLPRVYLFSFTQFHFAYVIFLQLHLQLG